MSSQPLVNSLIKNRLFKTASDIDEPPFQFINTMDLSLVDTTLHNSPYLVIHRHEIWAVWRTQFGRKKVWHFLTQQFSCCACAVCRYTVLLVKVKVDQDTCYSAAYMSQTRDQQRLLQSRKWQLTGMSQWCRSALCGHPLPALTDN